MESLCTVNGTEYRILSLLGHGKGGYSWLAEREGRHVVLKQIHHEPCAYYSFGSELWLYEGLSHGLYEEAQDFFTRVSAFCRK